MFRKKLMCAVMAACMLSAAGCSGQTAQDAENIDNSRAERQQSGKKNMEEATTTALIEGHEETVWVAGQSANITEVEEGQTVSGGGYDITVLESWKTDDTLAILDEITGDDTFRKKIINTMNLGSTISYDENGKYVGRSSVNHIVIRIRLKCTYIVESGRGKNDVMCMDPNLCVKSGNAYNMMTACEGIAYDKKEGEWGKDAILHTFTEGEELETLIVVRYPSSYSQSDDIYMFSGFINSEVFGDVIHGAEDGSYMFKLNLKDISSKG